MTQKVDLMTRHEYISNTELNKAIRNGVICLGGNLKLKIFGKLNCASGKRINRKNRVFFTSEEEAWAFGFRPCAHCLNDDYKKWKNELAQLSGLSKIADTR